MTRSFVIVWLVYWLTIYLLPVSSAYPMVAEALTLQLFFVLIVLGTFALAIVLSGNVKFPGLKSPEVSGSVNLTKIAIILSTVGLISLTYDKVVIQGIDYSQGLAFAREQWRRLGEQRDGSVSSIFSALGYIFGSFYFISAILIASQPMSYSRQQRFTYFILVVLLVLANSVLTGGRSNILLLVVMFWSALTARNKLQLFQLFSRKQLALVGLAGLLFGAYAMYIFFARASAGNESPANYLLNFLPHLGLKLDVAAAQQLGNDALGSVLSIAILSISYITHSFAVCAAILEVPSENKVIIFTHFTRVLYKLGFAEKPDTDWFLSGRFPSLPGALWHQYGLIGFVCGSSILGAISGFAQSLYSRYPDQLLTLGLYVFMATTLILSPILFSGDFLSFPFVVIALLILSAMQMLFRKYTAHQTHERRNPGGSEQ